MTDPRVGVVVITWNRRREALTAVGRLVALPERPHVVLVDNASSDGTAEAVRARFPEVEVVALPQNLGAVGRNIGTRRLRPALGAGHAAPSPAPGGGTPAEP
ncbi:glycosyltransferase [Microbispora sp. RL4-1S]|uniref:Glycosyltransferase n=1 Tax=Microbispora oryzae TaxID=2806554 RepID=A0A941AKT9_9ACTN|nr:glycosyltransferase [Microbispora oryzae]MBP2707815.1 glycosyltransferase [Microbispora oryzae]